ncbi:MAG: helix-turn-helix transcriptional regulator [Clostridia bacterium]|nr:helix-turn-helix transcriptional regulator [Clostridia bacterium]
MIKVTLSENLKLLMKENSLTQEQLSKRIGISQSAISAWLAGKKEPKIISLWKLADEFNITIDELLGRESF